jgi:integrase
MALEVKATSQWWYGRFMANGRRRRMNLGVRIEGARPASITDEGDKAFERSRLKALVAHDKILEEIQTTRTAEELRQRVMEIKIGARVESVALETLPDAWEKLPRRQKPSSHYISLYRKKLVRFVDFMKQNHPTVAELAGVQAEHVSVFLEEESNRGVSARTWNIMLGLLKGVFRKFEPGADAYRRFLLQTPQRREDTVHRQPFSPEEIDAVLDAAKTDDLVGPVIVTAICTAMRRGDCALLKWSSVDLREGFIVVSTSKTGAAVEIPILPRLRLTLVDAAEAQGERRSEFVFQEAAEVYRRSPDALDRRLKAVLLRAGFVDEADAERVQKRPTATDRPELPELPHDELCKSGFKAIEEMLMRDGKRATMKAVFRAYMSGDGMPEVARKLKISKSTVSLHLREIEKVIGVAVVRWRAATAPEVVRGAIHAAAGDTPRLKRGSTRGWHAFRTSFVTLALSAGMPMELVQRVTGHRTVAVVQKHYFQPGREQFRKAFKDAMPNMLTEGKRAPLEEAREIVARMTTRSLKTDKARLLELLA